MIQEFKPIYRHLNWNPNLSLNVKVDVNETLSSSYHYHPEIELILVRRSRGVRVIGTVRENFGENDLVLIGKNLPHAFFHDMYQDFTQENNPDAIVIQFNENFMGNDFLHLPEVKEINKLFSEARNGLSIANEGKEAIIPIMEQMPAMSAFDRMLSLLAILKTITKTNNRRLLVNEDNQPIDENTADERMYKILKYTQEQFHQDIKIEEVANLAIMTKESFCRYFKKQTKKTYIEFLIEFRIAQACKMIQENKMSIKSIGFSCGFNSLSNFHHQFKKITKMSPLDYKLNLFEKSLSLC
jgi:AraC-like DNA-binding protein